ncbi:sulfurtransferase [Neobacillus drentensis]|uniref:sulfurtransferase n=1 Tax=Neobacillus drentensis TaxID=220684 RepID=UPI00300243C3
MKFILDKEWLHKNLQDSHVRIVDCRFSLADPEKGRTEYLAGHLPGAVYFDLEKDLSSPVQEHGGRHPLPELTELVDKLETAGIDDEKVIVVYDNGEGAFAGRFWWLLRYLGHEQVYVLDGGFKQWVEANYPTTAVLPSFEKEKFNIQLKPEIMADIEEVKEAVLGKTDVVVIDSREEKRYLGIEEPIDKKAGHIPGAINKPWMAGLNNGSYKREEEQKERFSDVGEDKKIIVYCGSGVTATPNFLALKEAGYDNVKLYVGSFSDWISYEENKIE